MRKCLRRLVAAALCMILGAGLAGCSQGSSASTANINANSNSTAAANASISSSSTRDSSKDYYADDDFEFPLDYDEEREDVEKCTVIDAVSYYSSSAWGEKECAIVLPPGYREDEAYPVVYCLHGFDGGALDWLFVTTTYENMIADGLARKAILVLPNMYTSAKDYDECTQEEVRLAYDRFARDLEVDLMPFIQANYNVLQGRENTAIIGMSQGGTEALAIGFLLQDKIGYIASLAPAPGVIPTYFETGTFWNWPILGDFIIYDESTEPFYILLNIGSEDPWDLPCTIYYDEVLTDKDIPHDYYMLDGIAHDYEAWISGFYNFMMRIF